MLLSYLPLVGFLLAAFSAKQRVIDRFLCLAIVLIVHVPESFFLALHQMYEMQITCMGSLMGTFLGY